jgi:hypothetical protein
MPALDHRLQRWEDLLVSQIAGSTKEHLSIGWGRGHLKFFANALFVGRLFDMTTEFKAHCRQQLVLKIRGST